MKLERRAKERKTLPESSTEIDALCPVSEADVSLVYAVQPLKARLFRAKVALWSCGILGLVELLHLLYH
jgi:hypothetical protein